MVKQISEELEVFHLQRPAGNRVVPGYNKADKTFFRHHQE